MKLAACVLLALSAPVLAQGTSSAPALTGRDTITQKRVTEIINFLARDEMRGRDTPSPELEKAAQYLATHFKKAGLVPLGEKESYFHTYELPGLQFDTRGASLAVLSGGKKKVLRPGKDFRVYTSSRPYEKEAVAALVMTEVEAARRLRRSMPRRPVLVTISETSPTWKSTVGVRQLLLARRRLGRAPVILIREGLLPEKEQDGEEEQGEQDEGPEVEVKVAAPEKVQLKLKNVVGYLPGKKKPDEYVLFSAHYDHVGSRMSGGRDGIYNGADDNASGTTAVLALAEAFGKAKVRPDCSLVFVGFSAEEKGLLGSRKFAETPPIPLKEIRVNINIEMIGRPLKGNRKAAWVTGKSLSDFEEIAAAGFERAGIRIVNFPQAAMLFGASDNAPLARKGVVAHSISAGSLHKDYHGPGDEVRKIDLEHMTAIIRGLYEVGLEFANMKGRPEYNERGRRQLRLDRR